MKQLPESTEPFAGQLYFQTRIAWKHAFDYQEKQRGKKIRIELTEALAEFYGISGDSVALVWSVTENFNDACLMHDDIIDEDKVRRGAPAAWVKYGVPVALISAMYGYLAGLKALAATQNIDLVRVGLESLERMHIGQYLDVKINSGRRLPTREEYRLISEANTGCLFLLILDALQVLKPLPMTVYQSLHSMLLTLSLFYRIHNDYCDLNHIPWFDKKGFAPDLDAGPKSFLMLLAGKTLTRRTRSDEEKREIIRAYGRQGVFDRALQEMDDTFKKVLCGMDKVEHDVKQHQTAQRASWGQSNRLKALLHRLEFKQEAKDNYYLALIAQGDGG